MGSPGAQHSVAPIVAALIEDVVDTARHQAAASPTRRLESGLVLMLDECANIAPLGDLPKLAAELGGLGITTAVILQSVASARTIWGEAGERALRDLANITLVWGGQKDVAFLEEISAAGRRARRAGRDAHPERLGEVELVDATPHAGAAHRRHRQPGTQPRRGRVRPPAATDRPPAVLARRPGPRGAGRIGPAGRVEAARSCLKASATVRGATFGALVEDLVGRVEALHADVANLKSERSASADAGRQVPATRRTLPTGGEPVDLVGAGRSGSRASWSATPQQVTGSGRAGGVTGSSSRSWPRCAWHGSPSTTRASQSIRRRESDGTMRPRDVGNAYAGRSASVRAALPCRTSRMNRSPKTPGGSRSWPPFGSSLQVISKRKRSLPPAIDAFGLLRAIRPSACSCN